MAKGILRFFLWIFLALFLITFFGGGLLLFLNLFFHFLPEAAFAIIALIIIAEIVPLLIIAKAVSVVPIKDKTTEYTEHTEK